MLHPLRIQPDYYVGDLVVPDMPEGLLNYRGPYRKRKQQRWRREHPAYYVAAGRYYLLWGSVVVCHPDDARRLPELLNTGSKR